MIALFAILAILASAQAQCPFFGVLVGSQCWYTSSFNTGTDSCDSFCASIGASADANEIINVAGSEAADNSGCQAVVSAFGIVATVSPVSGANCQNSGLGCFFNIGQSLRCTSPTTTTSATATFPGGGRFCACDTAASSGFTDPHFSGFHGEVLDVRHDPESTNKYFNIFCKENVALNVLFSNDIEELLYMEKFVTKFGTFEMTMSTSELSVNGQFKVDAVNGDIIKYSFENGFAVAQNGDISVHFDDFIYEFSVQQGENGKYLNNYIQGPRKGQSANGIVGRSLARAFSEEEFSQYKQFMRSTPNDFTCEL
jgi:hypothetical protein